MDPLVTELVHLLRSSEELLPKKDATLRVVFLRERIRGVLKLYDHGHLTKDKK